MDRNAHLYCLKGNGVFRMTIYDDLLANGFIPSDIVSFTDIVGKPRQVTFSRPLSDSETKIYHDLLDPERVTRLASYLSSKEEMKAQYASVMTDLNTYIDYAVPTTQADFNSKVWTFTKLAARILRFILRLLRYMIFG